MAQAFDGTCHQVTMDGSGRLRLGICHCTVWRVTSQSLTHFDSTSSGGLLWFWVLAVGSSGPSAHIDLFRSVTEYSHRMTKTGGCPSLSLPFVLISVSPEWFSLPRTQSPCGMAFVSDLGPESLSTMVK